MKMVQTFSENYHKVRKLEDTEEEDGWLYRCYHVRKIGLLGHLECSIICDAYKIERYTPKGFIIRDFLRGRERWVSAHSRKRFAYPTIKEALDSYIARKRQEIRILKVRQKISEDGFSKAQKYYEQCLEDKWKQKSLKENY